jgi:O-antigen/teichoic acid export membrane protein
MKAIRKRFNNQLISSLKNTGWMFVDRMFRMATSLLVGIWLARYLGPEQFGTLNYAYVFPLVLSAFVSLGLNTVLTSEIPVKLSTPEADQIVQTSVLLKLVAGLLAFGVIVIANYLLHQHDTQLMMLVAISAASLLFQGFDAVDIYFQSVGKVHYSIIPKIVAFGLATVARLIGLVHEWPLSYFVEVTVIELAVGYLTIYGIYSWHRKLPFWGISIKRTLVLHLLKLSWPLMLAEFFIFMYMRLDQVMIEHLASSAELGKYSAALRLSEAWYFVAGALTASFYPGIITLRSQNYGAYLQRYQSLLNLLACLGLLISLLVSLLAEPISMLLYGQQYQGVGLILSIHIWTGLFVFLAVGSNNWFVVENMQRFLMGRTIAGALINIALNLVLIPRYGALGASVATLIAQISAAYLTNGLYRRTQEVFLLQTNALVFIPKWLFFQFRKAWPKPHIH